MIVADAAGIALVNHRLNQPAADNLTFHDDVAVALNNSISAVPASALAKDDSSVLDLKVSQVVAQNDAVAPPAVSREDPLPAPMKIAPLADLDTPVASPDTVKAMKAALRAPVVPAVRIAELHASHKANHRFMTAFASDASPVTATVRQLPSPAYAAPSPALGTVDMSASPVGQVAPSDNAPPADAVTPSAPVDSQVVVPTPQFGGSSVSAEPTPSPAVPISVAPATDEIPAS